MIDKRSLIVGAGATIAGRALLARLLLIKLRRDTARLNAGDYHALLAGYADDAAADQDVLALRDRVELVMDGPAGAPTRVELELDDRSVQAAACDVNTPAGDLGTQRERLEQKFRALSEPVLGAAGAARLLAMLGRAESCGVRELMGAGAPA